MRIVLADGTILNDSTAGYADGLLWLTITGKSLQECAMLFFDTSKTARIQFDYGEMRDVYEGYTVCTNLSIDTDGVVRVSMVKGVTE